MNLYENGKLVYKNFTETFTLLIRRISVLRKEALKNMWGGFLTNHVYGDPIPAALV